jgi:hypothetical protein
LVLWAAIVHATGAACMRPPRVLRSVLELDASLKPEQVRLRLRVLVRLDPENCGRQQATVRVDDRLQVVPECFDHACRN